MRSGRYITQLVNNREYRVFIPNPLPFELDMKPALQDLLSRVNFSLGRLNGIVEMIPGQDSFLLMQIRKEAVISSQIAGTQTTLSDALRTQVSIKNSQSHEDTDTISTYIKALDYGLNRLKTLPLSIRLIKETHGLLIKETVGTIPIGGKFRGLHQAIPSPQTAGFVPPPFEELWRLLDNFEDFLHNPSSLPLLIKTGILYCQFENIRPFLKGNGKMARLLITLYLCQQGLLKQPVLCLSEFIRSHTQDYYSALDKMRQKDDIEGWLKFFLEAAAQTAQKTTETIKQLIGLRQDDTDKVKQLGRSAKKGIKLLNFLYKNPMVMIKDIEQAVGLRNPNALVLLSKFLKIGILNEVTGQKRGKIFACQEYIKIFE